jgi:Fe-S-cluster containining protein
LTDQQQMTERLERARQAGPGALAQACAALLAEARGVGPAAAARAVGNDRALGNLIAETAPAPRLAACLADLARAKRCLGCATCCRASSPTLYVEDLPRLKAAGLGWESLVTLRAGERAHSARLGGLQTLERELIKLRERGGSCAWLGGGGCRIYEQRPLQCRWLECWSGRHAGQLEDRPRLSRADLLADDPIALALAEEYEVKLPAEALHRALAQAAQGEDQALALALLELDHHLRLGIGERYGYRPQTLHLVLGRPAAEVAANYGLELSLKGVSPVLRSR